MLLSLKKEGTVKMSYRSVHGLLRTVWFVIELRLIMLRDVDVRLNLSAKCTSDLQCFEADNLELYCLSF